MIKKVRTLIGIVISKPGQKTAKVLVETTSSYPKYKKVFIRRKKYLVDDEKNVQIGDKVVIVSTRPISKLKNFKVQEVVK
ncbi:MAG: 30S ribosomal protein S17 [Candidatus Shapirobacteria bacterium]|nr:30S ribosomal protein S17 [Candidatus Shapirobacteria bacterium]